MNSTWGMNMWQGKYWRSQEEGCDRYIYKMIPYLRLGEHCIRGGREIAAASTSGVYFEIVSPYNVRSYTCQSSPTWPPKCEANKHDTNDHAKLDGEKPTRHQPYRKNYRQLGKSGSRRGYHPREKHNQLVTLFQTFSSENIHTSSIIGTKQVIFSNVYNIYIYACNKN